MTDNNEQRRPNQKPSVRKFPWVKSDATLGLGFWWDRQWKVVTVYLGPFHCSWEYGED